MQRDAGAAFGETGGAAFGAAFDDVTGGRIEILELEGCFEGGGYRSDFGFDRYVEMLVVDLLDALTTGNAGAENFRIVQRRPDVVA